MARKTNATTDLPTACRFAVLGVSDESEEEEGTKVSNKNDAKKITSASNTSSSATAKKKRNKKRRNKTKNSQGDGIETVTSTESQLETAHLNDIENGWEKWQNRDEQFVIDQFQKDLQAALEESKIMTSLAMQQANDNSSTKKKKKEKTISLNEFIGGNLSKDVKDQSDTNVQSDSKSMFALDTFQESQSVSSELHEKVPKPKSKKKTHDKSNNILESGLDSKVHKVIPASQEESIKAEMVHVQEELSKKDEAVTKMQQTIEKQKSWISDLQKELVQVKKRNKQLCHILGQGEMKEKSDLLLQIEELSEFREQVVQLHAELEQERSKSSALRQELVKHQSSHTRGRHGSSS